MDRWQHKLNKLSQARTKDAKVAIWGKAALVVGAIAAIWLLMQDRTHSLQETPAAETAETTDIEAAATIDNAALDGFALFYEQKFADALPLLLPLADAGSGHAQCAVGKILAQGLGGTEPDKIEGTKWLDLCLRAPDDAGDDEARDLMDQLIKTAGWDIVGEGKLRAFQWQQAKINTERHEPGSASELALRELGTMDGNAAFALGSKLNDGTDSPVDYEKALRCFKRAAEFNIAEAHFNIAVAYYAGKGVKADPREALHWFKKAAEGNFAEAATMVGIMAARGDGMDPDIDMALGYLKQGADLGDPDAGLIREAVASGNIPQ
ncbi:MAG: sel1 repeat family protein [Proteobacteria bacterium]|nr:sel1 repeat family protein [Pseudomonadota bacterium]